MRDAGVVGAAGNVGGVAGACGDLLEEEKAHRRQNPPLVWDRGGQDVVVGGDPVADDQQHVIVVDPVNIADLARADMGVIGQLRAKIAHEKQFNPAPTLVPREPPGPLQFGERRPC